MEALVIVGAIIVILPSLCAHECACTMRVPVSLNEGRARFANAWLAKEVHAPFASKQQTRGAGPGPSQIRT